MTAASPIPDAAAAPDSVDHRGAALVWGLLLLLLVINVPLFLCMPLTDDAAMFDLQALNLLRGGVLYRDILEPNLPGVIWIHALVRAALGTSSLALRAVDVLFFSVFALLSRNWLGSCGRPRAAQAWLVLVLFFCYFSLSEWCHCQRDVWLLVPALAGLTLRRRQMARLRTAPSPPRWVVGLVSGPTVGWAFCEGMCWGAGVWLKPTMILPAACCWGLSVFCIRSWRSSLVDLVGLVSGGLLIGGLGVAWLVWSGAWPYFVTTLVEWNPQYMAAAREQWTLTRYVAMQVRFFPWQLLHLAAIPIAVAAVGRQGWKSRKVEKSKSERVQESRIAGTDASDFSTFPPFHFSTPSLLSVFYLAWLVQSYLLQHLFDYVHAPALLLAIVLVAASWARRPAAAAAAADDRDSADEPATKAGPDSTMGRFAWRLSVAAFAILALLTTPVVSLPRLACWPACVTQGSTAEVRDRLKTFSVPSWRDLERVAAFLGDQGVRDEELTCYNSSLVHLYGILGLGPSTRYVYLEQVAIYFPERREAFLQALLDSRQRYVVTDLIASGLTPGGIARLCAEGPLARPPRFPSHLRDVYPWSQPAVFRAGPYLVHRIERPLGRLEGPPRSG